MGGCFFMRVSEPIYKRVLLKLSGEALSKNADGILNFNFIKEISNVIKKCQDEGVQVAIIVGAGNIWRGRSGTNMSQARADHMGMLATTINALALQDVFENEGIKTITMSAIHMDEFAEHYESRNAIKYMNEGYVVIFGGGLGIPYFSTDTAAVLRAAEINAEVVLMAKNIDGVYSADPQKDASAVKYNEISYKEIIDKELHAIDLTAAAFCLSNNIKCYAFELKDPMNIYKVIMGEKIGTELYN